jgi:ribosomal protein L29
MMRFRMARTAAGARQAMTFDTLAVSKRLRQAGFTEPQAEAVTAAISDGRQFDLAQLATKADLAELRTATKADLAELRTATKADVAELKADLAELRTATKADVAELKADLAELQAATRADLAQVEAKIAQTETRIVKWFAGLLVTQVATVVGVVVTIATLLPRAVH